LPIRRGRVFANRPIPKLEQQENFRRNGIPTPPAMSFRFGMKLDPILFGEHVILKPSDLGLTSRADGIHVLRRKHVEGLGPGDFPKDHPIRVSRNGYIVQKFVPTGTFSTTYRVSTFLGAVIDAAMHQSTIESPALDAPDAALLAGNFTHKAGRKVVFEAPDDVIELAIKVAKIFGTLPLLGIDVIRDVHTGRLFVLEINAGGNTWHYSSPMAAEWRKKHPELLRAMKEQFSAFDTVAAVLARHVAELAA